METAILELLDGHYSDYQLIYISDLSLLVNICSDQIQTTSKLLSELELIWLEYTSLDNPLLYTEIANIVHKLLF